MKRRALLGALTGGLAGLAGCQGFGGGSDAREDRYEVPERETPTVTTTEPVPGADPESDPEPLEPLKRTVSTQVGAGRSLTIADQPLSTYPGPGRYTVGFTTPPSLTTPATVWVEFTSTADQPRTYEFGPSPPFSNYVGVRTDVDSPEPGLLLVPMDGRPFPYEDPTPGVPTNGRWVATKTLESPEREVEARSIELDPGGWIVGKYLLLRYPGAGELPRRGTYSFRNDGWPEALLSVSVWDPELRTARESRFEGRTPPNLPYNELTEWYHRTGDRERTAYLEPSRELVELPRGVLSPSVENLSSGTVGVSTPALFKLQYGRWYRVAPLLRSSMEPRYVAPGGSKGWVVSIDNDAAPGESTAVGGSSLTLSGLGSGTYALGALAYGVPGPPVDDTPIVLGDDTGTDDSASGFTILGALVDLLGGSVPIARSPNATVVDRGEDVVSLVLEPRETPTDWEPTTVLTVFERSAEATVDERIIPEQVYRARALLNALATFEEADAETVRVRTSEALARQPIRAFGDGDLVRFSFEGTTYGGLTAPTDDDSGE